jgi:uncharacterized membrane protein YqgA involved in biofilm formation
MTGVLLNIVTVLVGTATGLLFGRLIPERLRQIVFYALGSCTIGFGAITTVDGYHQLSATQVGSFSALVLVISLVAGALTGEALRIEHRLEQLGQWLHDRLPRRRAGATDGSAGGVLARSDSGGTAAGADSTSTAAGAAAGATAPASSSHFAEGFMTASIFFCVGAMTFLGSIQAGLGDPSTLYLKSLLDGIAAIALTTALGIGVGFSALTIAVVEGGIALLAILLGDFFTPAIIGSLNLTGGVMLIALGIEIIGIKKLRVANMLPALLVALVLAVCLG